MHTRRTFLTMAGGASLLATFPALASTKLSWADVPISLSYDKSKAWHVICCKWAQDWSTVLQHFASLDSWTHAVDLAAQGNRVLTENFPLPGDCEYTVYTTQSVERFINWGIGDRILVTKYPHA